MALPPSARATTDRPFRAAAGWVAMAKAAYMRPAKVQDAPRSVQSDSALERVRILFRCATATNVNCAE
jgi:hypothetical protein